MFNVIDDMTRRARQAFAVLRKSNEQLRRELDACRRQLQQQQQQQQESNSNKRRHDDSGDESSRVVKRQALGEANANVNVNVEVDVCSSDQPAKCSQQGYDEPNTCQSVSNNNNNEHTSQQDEAVVAKQGDTASDSFARDGAAEEDEPEAGECPFDQTPLAERRCATASASDAGVATEIDGESTATATAGTTTASNGNDSVALLEQDKDAKDTRQARD